MGVWLVKASSIIGYYTQRQQLAEGGWLATHFSPLGSAPAIEIP